MDRPASRRARAARPAALAALAALAVPGAAAARQAPQIEEIAVVGRYVPDEKRATSAVSNVVGAEQFARTGDSDVAESLKRVAGLSTVGGKFVYVRGLGERYSTTLLNGAVLPSPEPVNRVVPLDLFPTAVLDSVLVQKTYSAQFPSEFGGGVLQLRTKKSTDEFFLNVSSSVGMNDRASFREGLAAGGGDLAWLGYDGGHRALPEPLRRATEGGRELKRKSAFLGGGGYTPAELQAIGRSLRNEYAPAVEEMPPDFDFSVSLGNWHPVGADGGARLSYLAAADYSNGWDADEIVRRTYRTSDAGLELDDDLLYRGAEHSIDLSGILTAGLDFGGGHNIRATGVLLRKTDGRVGVEEGDLAQEAYVRRTELEWIERELLSGQLQGDHYFPGLNELTVGWRYSEVKAERDSPDHRRYRYDLENDGRFRFSTRADGNVRRWSALDDDAKDIGLDLSMVFHAPRGAVVTAQAGYVRTEKERASEIRRYSFFDQGAAAFDEELLARPLEEVLAAENIGPHGFELREFTRPTDNYRARNDSESFYLQGELNLDDRLRLNAGVRREAFSQTVDTFDLFRDVSVVAGQESEDWLPAAGATLISGDHQFRIAYSETLSRPDFRELSPAAFTNPVTGREVAGNPELEIASITNYDFRWEWYFGFGDYMSAGVFHKEFDRPIESVIEAGAEGRQTFANAGAGENRGAEWEVRKRLGFLGGRWEDWYVQSNVAYIESSVELRDEDRGVLTSVSRPLQGQSDWLFNAQLGYEPFTGVTATLLYHYFGERVAEVGIEGAPDLIEQPFGELNLIYIHELGERWKLQLKLKNILDERSAVAQGGLETTGYNRGRRLSLKADYAF